MRIFFSIPYGISVYALETSMFEQWLLHKWGKIQGHPTSFFTVSQAVVTDLITSPFLLLSAQACHWLFLWSITHLFLVSLFSHCMLSIPSICNINHVLCRHMQAGVGQHCGHHLWEKEEQWASVHLITWPPIAFLNELNTFSVVLSPISPSSNPITVVWFF